MSDILQEVFSNVWLEDISGAASGTSSVMRRQLDGSLGPESRTYVNAGNLYLDDASATTFGTTYISGALAALAAGTGLTKASTSAAGIVYRMSAAPLVVGQPIAMEQNDPVISRIPNASIAAGLTAGTSPSASNPFITQTAFDAMFGALGTGKDGTFAVGSITDPVTAPSGLTSSVLVGAVPAGTYTYKISLWNMSGDTLPTSASSSITLASASSVTMTIPLGGAATQGRKIWRDNGSSSWKLVGVIGNNTDTTFTDSLPITSATTAPGSNTTGATWATPTGEWDFTGDMSLPAITLGTTGSSAGNLIIRCRGNVTITGAITANGSVTTPGLGGGQYGQNGYTVSVTGQSNGGPGMGTNWQMVDMGGVGGASNAGGTGGNAGGTVRIYAYSITISANCSANGTAGGNAAQGGGGGAGGTLVFVARDFISAGAFTVSANGAAGGNGSTSAGGGGGGGGYCMFLAPVINTSAATITVSAGAAGTNTAANSTAASGGGGGNAGAGGYGTNWNIVPIAGTAGQIIYGGTNAVGYRFPTHVM